MNNEIKKQMLAAGDESAKELSKVGKTMSGAISDGVGEIQNSMTHLMIILVPLKLRF